MNIAVGRQYRDRDGDTWTVMDDGMLVWDKSANFHEPLIQSFQRCESERGPLRRTVEYPLDVDLDGLDVNPHEADDPQIRHDHDPVNSPAHYQSGGMEAIDVIEAFFAHDYHLGNVFKYLARAGKKDDIVQDLEKAQWYLARAIEREKES